MLIHFRQNRNESILIEHCPETTMWTFEKLLHRIEETSLSKFLKAVVQFAGKLDPQRRLAVMPEICLAVAEADSEADAETFVIFVERPYYSHFSSKSHFDTFRKLSNCGLIIEG